jgi:hypothetical protein
MHRGITAEEQKNKIMANYCSGQKYGWEVVYPEPCLSEQ